jgi:hypothetical protein
MKEEGASAGGTTRSLVSKVDTRILPTLFALYFFTIFARNNIANAQVEMIASLNLSENQYRYAYTLLLCPSTIAWLIV